MMIEGEGGDSKFLIAWTDRDEAPDRILATKFSEEDKSEVEMQRPICPYPQKAAYRGKGSTRSASNFVCTGSPPR